MLIFDLSQPGRRNLSQAPRAAAEPDPDAIPADFLRQSRPVLPEVSELDAVRHYTNLSRKNYSIDTQFYPLGSCTMKYNPRACNYLAMLPQFLARHPSAPSDTGQGFLACMYELQEMLKDVTGMAGVSLAPMAGAQGEFAGVAMIRAYHSARGDNARTEILVPNAAHGTNPASAVMCGYTAREIHTDSEGNVDLAALRAVVGPHTAGLMLTNPSTLGVFERAIMEIREIVHAAGGLLYYDGANLNAILGKVKPGDMGFDVIHMNLHKTFSTPHGGGGPGAGPVGVATRLLPYLPLPVVVQKDDAYRLQDEQDLPHSIGRLSAHAGNAGVLLRAYIITLKDLKDKTGVTAMDVAKRLLDKGFHAPTTYFPLLVPECLLIEPTETESRQTLDAFVQSMKEILAEAHHSPDVLKSAPHTTPVRRLDDVKAARELNLTWQPAA